MKKVLVLMLITAVFLFGCTQQAAPANGEPAQVTITENSQPNAQPNPSAPDNEPETNESDVSNIESEPMMNASQEPSMSIKEFNITARTWEFQPSTITVNRGDTVRLAITSVDVAHGFALSEFNVNTRLEPGQTANVEFVVDQVGQFSFFCSVFCGNGHGGMRGTLIVEE